MKMNHVLTEGINDIVKGRIITMNEEIGDEAEWAIGALIKIMKENNIPIFKVWIDEEHNREPVFGYFHFFFPRNPFNENQVKLAMLHLFWKDWGTEVFQDMSLEDIEPKGWDEMSDDEKKKILFDYIRVRKI